MKSEEKEIICLCPYPSCKKQIKMKFNVSYLGINVKEMRTLQKKIRLHEKDCSCFNCSSDVNVLNVKQKIKSGGKLVDEKKPTKEDIVGVGHPAELGQI